MRDEKFPAVYIIANARNGTIYIGVTSALWNRIASHKSKSLPGFSSKYGIAMLVWYEHHHTMTLPSVTKSSSRNRTAAGNLN